MMLKKGLNSDNDAYNDKGREPCAAFLSVFVPSSYISLSIPWHQEWPCGRIVIQRNVESQCRGYSRKIREWSHQVVSGIPCLMAGDSSHIHRIRGRRAPVWLLLNLPVYLLWRDSPGQREDFALWLSHDLAVTPQPVPFLLPLLFFFAA